MVNFMANKGLKGQLLEDMTAAGLLILWSNAL